MSNASTGMVAVICGIAGMTMGTAVGFVVALLFLGSETVSALTTASGDYSEYFNVEVVEFEKRDDGVYIKFKNTGRRAVDDMYFEVEERNGDGRLVEEYQVSYSHFVPAGAVEEALLKPLGDDDTPVDIEGDVTVAFSYGWVTNHPAQ